MSEPEKPTGFSSPACSLHEFPQTAPAEAGTWEQIKRWRKTRREQLIAQRMQLDAAERHKRTARLLASLIETVDARTYPVLGLYWPIRGEPDLRQFARRHVAAGGIVALPVVVRPAAPVEFWRWLPGVALKRGLWNIPVPPQRAPLAPQLLIVPLVGFDRAGYRLGYGGGFYDRTLAAADPRPRTIGVGLADAELSSIHPQPFDIPMDEILTERFKITAGA